MEQLKHIFHAYGLFYNRDMSPLGGITWRELTALHAPICINKSLSCKFNISFTAVIDTIKQFHQFFTFRLWFGLVKQS